MLVARYRANVARDLVQELIRTRRTKTYQGTLNDMGAICIAAEFHQVFLQCWHEYILFLSGADQTDQSL
eukprot:CAMPEP_0172794472 /NCGR_PEP_ID=MMETSP1074-20121228/209997_1 /TAXON_ID=2916 /ORGANISM="Ceratium fusus, Strain PA161109" /LENGTH=68 /DNA_ID=CAMNT_0013631551 /DNA_START=491 /DNA_END=697 /DNA_ORIENTATION=+